MNRLISVLIGVFFSLFFLISCGESDREDDREIKHNNTYEPVSGDWLIYHLGSEPATLNPITATDVYESLINGGKVYETLTKRDNSSLEIIPLLAESWEISEDKLSFIFQLKKNIKWHDGTPFTSKDVVFSYKSIMDPKVDAPHLKSYYRELKSVEAIDDYTVKFTYLRPYFLALEFSGGMPIVPEHIFKKGNFNKNPAGRHPIGTGPYKFVEWKTGNQIILEKNEDYWKDKPKLNKIVFKIINDETVKFQVLKKGDLDRAGLTPIQWDKQSKTEAFNKNFNKHAYFTPNYSFIGWNQKKPFFSDKKVRRAMTHFLNRELVLKKILIDLGAIVTSPFFIKSPEYPTDIKPYEYDPQKAVELLAEAGWIDSDSDGIRDKEGVKFEFEFLIPSGSDTGEKIATILKEELRKAGIVMNIRKTEWAVFTQRLNQRKFDAVTLGWSMGVESDPYQIWSSSQAESGSNFVNFKNEEADKLIEMARTEFDRKKRIKLYRRFAEIVHEEQPYTFLFGRQSTVAVSKRFKNVTVYPLGLDLLEWFVPEPLQKYGVN
ncbi:MAG: peptide-binding protein [Candidatus Dadabacteria bacterium]|nr:peptide-binding protein [Candidatus Dadabacteria bacterium]NIQ13344.1 peptide-binding protein [Candidatus Dadabacteria bacterium]